MCQLSMNREHRCFGPARLLYLLAAFEMETVKMPLPQKLAQMSKHAHHTIFFKLLMAVKRSGSLRAMDAELVWQRAVGIESGVISSTR